VAGWTSTRAALPAVLRAARRGEVDDDLWCQREEAEALGRSPRSLAGEILLRLFLGMPADISWRVSHGGRASKMERSSSMSTRIIGSLGVIAGAGFTYLLARAIATPGDAMWNGTYAWIAVVAFLAGGLAFVGAAIGLTWRFQDELRPLGVIGGLVAGLSTLIGVVASDAPVVLLGLPIGSAMLAWDLGRGDPAALAGGRACPGGDWLRGDPDRDADRLRDGDHECGPHCAEHPVHAELDRHWGIGASRRPADRGAGLLHVIDERYQRETGEGSIGRRVRVTPEFVDHAHDAVVARAGRLEATVR
jgi:hypothetical protein